MSKNISIKTSKGLSAFLALLAEESVTRARDDLRNGTYASEEEIFHRASGIERKTQGGLSKDLDRLSSSWGQEFRPQQAAEEADEDIFKKIGAGETGKSDKSDSKTKQKSTSSDDEPSTDEEEPDDDASSEDHDGDSSNDGEERISFTMIRDKLNTIRSGRSLRDKDIRGELKDYVTALDPDEKIALHAFLDGIGQILTAGIASEDADDPSEDPHDIEMTKNDNDDDGSQVISQPQEKKKTVTKKPVNRNKQRGLEDTSAPIQVGKKQATESLRRKIRELMG